MYEYYKKLILNKVLEKESLNFEILKKYIIDIDFDLSLQDFKIILKNKIEDYIQKYSNYFAKYYSHMIPTFLLSKEEITNKKQEIYNNTIYLWQEIHSYANRNNLNKLRR